MMGWQPIETAPLAYGFKADIWMVHEDGRGQGWRAINCTWDSGGWTDEDGDPIGHEPWVVTHWMPPPEPPA